MNPQNGIVLFVNDLISKLNDYYSGYKGGPLDVEYYDAIKDDRKIYVKLVSKYMSLTGIDYGECWSGKIEDVSIDRTKFYTSFAPNKKWKTENTFEIFWEIEDEIQHSLQHDFNNFL